MRAWRRARPRNSGRRLRRGRCCARSGRRLHSRSGRRRGRDVTDGTGGAWLAAAPHRRRPWMLLLPLRPQRQPPDDDGDPDNRHRYHPRAALRREPRRGRRDRPRRRRGLTKRRSRLPQIEPNRDGGGRARPRIRRALAHRDPRQLAELGGERERVVRSPGGILRQRRHDEILQRGRDADARREGRRRFLQMRVGDPAVGRLVVERTSAREHLVEDEPRGVEVRPRRDRLAAELAPAARSVSVPTKRAPV